MVVVLIALRRELRKTIDNAEQGKKWADWISDLDQRMVSLRSVTDVKKRLEF
jgi:hypothetical protein